MPKIIIYDRKNILIADLDGKIETNGDVKRAYFKNYNLVKSQTIKKHIKRIEAVLKYERKKEKNE
ncbi:MAG: hypothetical protein J5507_00360 [Clostridia bacterium]|nr:hypothetical protein [Clostridia bacterium]